MNIREQLLAIELVSTDSFDRTVLTLSGGALGLSMIFLNDIVEPSKAVQTLWLIIAWACWAVSLILSLSSFWLSAQAKRKTIQQLDDGRLDQEPPGGLWDRSTALLTPLGGLAFIIGVGSMIVFIHSNL